MKKIIAAFIISGIAITAYAQEPIEFRIAADRSIVGVGEILNLNVSVNSAERVAVPGLQDIDGFNVNGASTSQSISIVNGRTYVTLSYTYRLVAAKEGKFKIGPFTLGYRGRVYTSNQVEVEVIKGRAPQAAAPSPAQVQQMRSQASQASSSLGERIAVKAEVGKTTAYINDPIPLKIKFYIKDVGIKGMDFPSFAHENFSMTQLSQPEENVEVLNGVMYKVFVFNSSLYAAKPGDFTLGPAEVNASIIIKKSRRSRSVFDDNFDDDFFDEFFGGYDLVPVTRTSNTVNVKILDLPQENRPADFSGAVGAFKLDVKYTPLKVKMGDPVTITMKITGDGNFDTVSAPLIKANDDYKVYEPKVIKQEGNEKIFEQVIIPKKIGQNELPQIVFPYFNTQTRAYETITKAPVVIEVLKPDVSQEQTKIVESMRGRDESVAREILGQDINYIKDSPGNFTAGGARLYRNKTFLRLQFAPMVFLILIAGVRLRQERLRTDKKFAGRLKASKQARQGIQKVGRLLKNPDPKKFYDEMYRVIREYIGNKFQISSGGITMDDVDNVLKTYGISEETIGKVREILNECDMARYAQSSADRKKMGGLFEMFKSVIYNLERAKN